MKATINVGFILQQSSAWMGGLNYFKNLFIAISTVRDPMIQPYIPLPKDPASKVLLDYSCIVESYQIKTVKFYLKKLKNKITGKNFCEKKNLKNIYKNLDLTSHSILINNLPGISWIPDFQHLHLPEMFDKKDENFRNRDFLKKAKKSTIVVLSSNNALEDYAFFAPQYKDKGRVLHFVSAIDSSVYTETDKQGQEIRKKYGLPEKYFYLPNQFWKHKNHGVVLKAISFLKKRGVKVNIVFSGNTQDYRFTNYFNEIVSFIKEEGISENVYILGVIDPMEVYYLMRNCVSLINPSLFEGWSSTVEEAKSLGKNIILSNLPVHREQNPQAAIFFDPNNPEELSEILKEKWIQGHYGPDKDLEELAVRQLNERIIDFGKNYQKIVLECLEMGK